MRIGTNPEKINIKYLTHKPHRVIIPVYIPNLEDKYFRNGLAVLKICLDSIMATTNPEQTNITVINNNCCPQVDDYLEDLVQQGLIEKYVKHAENRGKVEPVLSEAMASYEEFITISDADVLFKKAWLTETMKIFKMFKAGVVMPMPTPNNYALNNVNCFNTFFLKGLLKKGSVVNKQDLISFEQSVGSKSLMQKHYHQQFFVEQAGVSACLGAGHFVATYDRQIFDYVDRYLKVTHVFKGGQERNYLDNLTTLTGTFRLSTIKPFVYHMGNTIPDTLESEVHELTSIGFPFMPKRSRVSKIRLFMDKVVFKIITLWQRCH